MPSFVATPSPMSVAIVAAREASKVLLKHYEHLSRVESKTVDRNLVTIADRESEQCIKDLVLGVFPDHTLLGEEESRPDPGKRFCWIVDPIDGTVNYVHGFPHFCISIALQEHGETILGVIYDPLRDEMFTAQRGQGAYLNARKISVTRTAKLGDALLATGFPYEIEKQPVNPIPLFGAFVGKARGIRRPGSAALDLAYVAAGRMDGFWEVALEPWDVAAGLLILAEAGGKATNLWGGPLDIFKCRLVSSNGHIHDAMLDVIRPLVGEPLAG